MYCGPEGSNFLGEQMISLYQTKQQYQSRLSLANPRCSDSGDLVPCCGVSNERSLRHSDQVSVTERVSSMFTRHPNLSMQRPVCR